MGASAESLRLLTKTENRTSQHSWRGSLQWSLDGKDWNPSTPTPLIASAIVANGSTIHAEYTDRDKFCAPQLQFLLATANSGAGGARESATVWAWLVVTFLT